MVDARSERLFSTAANRRTEPCPVAGTCGGCSLQHLPHGDQLALKQRTLAEQLERFAGLVPQEWAAPLVGPEFGYRRRARLAVRWDAKARRLDVGFRAAASQEIVAFDECLVLVPPLQTVLARELPALLRGFAKPQSLGHVELFHGTSSALLLRHIEPLSDSDRARLLEFCSARDVQLWLQGDGEPTLCSSGAENGGNRELGFRLEAWNLTLAYRPGDFVQVNAPVNEAMIAQALDWLAPAADERVLDLFCGLGNFALPLARQVARSSGGGRCAGHGRAGCCQCPCQRAGQHPVPSGGPDETACRSAPGRRRISPPCCSILRATEPSRRYAKCVHWAPGGYSMCPAIRRPWRATLANWPGRAIA